MRVLLFAGVIALSAAPILAQAPEPLAKTAPFAQWIGEWKGTGWSFNQAGERTEFSLTESVKEKSAGTVLLIEGHGTRSTGAVSHDGIVLVYRDNAGKPHWNGHEAASEMIDAELATTANSMSWSFKARGATIRFVITLDQDTWIEIGEVSGDGVNWSRFMEMTLRR